MDHLKLTTDKLSVETISELVTDNSCGAVSLFVGTTRDSFEGKTVLRLEYEAYEPMALKAMQGICEEVRTKWPAVHSIAMYHRLGVVPTREASVVIAVSSPHRGEALAAVGHCIDRLKSSVPVWKKEVYAAHEPVWKENKECQSQPTTAPSIGETSEPVTPPVAPSAEMVDKSMIQINVSSEELQRRINNFIERKRDQLNLSNIQDFIPGASLQDGDEETCARVRTRFIKRSDSKGHLKIRKVHNEWGPMTVRARPRHDSDTTGGGGGGGALPPAVAERVTGLERSLRLAPVSRDVYARLKAVEDRLAWLQTLSPEYSQFWSRDKTQEEGEEGREFGMEYTFSADDIARKIEQFEREGNV